MVELHTSSLTFPWGGYGYTLVSIGHGVMAMSGWCHGHVQL